ncbi:solute carrier family 25 member 38-like protein [Leptotrombidium deliense]|uniref:Mitochondrial glycine transporter n=1 Tax=Leptotrombidium deliense TaxID=299467 RepID=A0A443S2J0_9ACAR|nr:solute carrier family 25 member 38-like protein [Leptotrombidium deliense]
MSFSTYFQFFGDNSKLITGFANQHPVIKSFLIGSVSGTSSTLLFQPFELIKTRMQNASASGKRRMMPLIIDVVRKEHVAGLWKGTVPSLVRCVPGVGLYFSTMSWMQTYLLQSQRPNALEAILMGVAARSFAGCLLMPFTVIKTRYESGLFQYTNVTEAVRVIYTTEGMRSLFRGLTPTLLRDAPFSGLYYMFYSQLKRIVEPTGSSQPLIQIPADLQAVSIFACGLSAGLLASLVTHPADVLKTKMQLHPQGFSNIFHVASIITREEGLRVLFAGVVPRMMRRTLMATMAWTFYESLMQNVGLKK